MNFSVWYTVDRGFITGSICFDSYEDAELYCLATMIATGETWWVRDHYGFAR